MAEDSKVLDWIVVETKLILQLRSLNGRVILCCCKQATKIREILFKKIFVCVYIFIYSLFLYCFQGCFWPFVWMATENAPRIG